MSRGVVGAVIVFLASGCGLLGGETDAPSDSGRLEKSKIKLGTMPTIGDAPVHIAVKNGYFKDEGLEVELVTHPGGEVAITKLIGGDVDVTVAGWSSFLIAQEKGVGDFALISDSYQTGPGTVVVMAMPGSSIKTPADLIGKKVAVTVRDGITAMLTRSTVRTSGVSGAIAFVEIPIPDMPAALKSQQVDAAVVVEPFVTSIKDTIGAVPVIDVASGATADFPTTGYGTTAGFAKDNPRTTAAFQRAMTKAQGAAANRTEVEEVIQRYAKVSPAVARRTLVGAWPTSIDASRLRRVNDLLVADGQVAKPVDIESMVWAMPK